LPSPINFKPMVPITTIRNIIMMTCRNFLEIPNIVYKILLILCLKGKDYFKKK